MGEKKEKGFFARLAKNIADAFNKDKMVIEKKAQELIPSTTGEETSLEEDAATIGQGKPKDIREEEDKKEDIQEEEKKKPDVVVKNVIEQPKTADVEETKEDRSAAAFEFLLAEMMKGVSYEDARRSTLKTFFAEPGEVVGSYVLAKHVGVEILLKPKEILQMKRIRA